MRKKRFRESQCAKMNMLTLNDAVQLAETRFGLRVTAVGETEDLWVLYLDNDDESYVTYNKNTGKQGEMWIADFIDLIEKGKTKVIANGRENVVKLMLANKV